MTSVKRLEILMQRAVDGELTPSQRHELLESIESCPEGWKRLACNFLEEQLVGQGVRQAPAVAEETVVRPQRRHQGFWYQHPMLATAVTICLAFTLGFAASLSDRSFGSARPAPVAATAPEPIVSDTVGVDTTPQTRDREQEFYEQLRQQLNELDQLLNSNQPRSRARR